MNAVATDHQPAGTVLIGGDLPVRRIGYGALRLSDPTYWRPPAQRTAAIRMLRLAVEEGADLIDTADSYALGANEELIAEALHPYDGRVVIATKVGQCRPAPDVWIPLGRPEYLRQQVELSLRRLRVECLDLLQLHRIDPSVPLEDQIGALHQLRVEGKVRHIGLCKVSVAEIQRALRVTAIATVQNPYNVVDRGFEESLVWCQREGTAFIAWLPLKQGRLATAESAVATVARRLGCTAAQVSLAWLTHRSPVLVPIPGTTSPTHLRANLAAAAIRLSDRDMDLLSGIG